MGMNIPLKVAIWESDWTQIALAKAAGMHESRLSNIVHEHYPANAAEQKLLAKLLKKKVSDLWVAPAAPVRPTPRVREAMAS